MKKKFCKICTIEKNLDQFVKDKNRKDGYRGYCKTCEKEKNKKWKIENPEKFKEKGKIHREKYKKEIKEYQDDYRKNNKKKIKQRNVKYREKNKESLKEKRKKYVSENKEKILESAKNYRRKEGLRDKNIEYQKNYRKRNKESLKIKRNQYIKSKLEIDPLFKLKKIVKTLICNSLNRTNFLKNNRRTVDIIGCSIDFFKKHLESKFEPWMNWDNKGKYNGKFNYGWDIDHIIPICTAKTEEEVIRLNHYTNLQPLCSKINREIKKNKVYNNEIT